MNKTSLPEVLVGRYFALSLKRYGLGDKSGRSQVLDHVMKLFVHLPHGRP